LNIKRVSFSGTFAKQRKATISFFVFVFPSVRPHGTILLPQDVFFMKIYAFVFFENLSRKLKFH